MLQAKGHHPATQAYWSVYQLSIARDSESTTPRSFRVLTNSKMRKLLGKDKAMTEDQDGVTFERLGLRPELLAALSALGYEEPTPIQQEAIPPLVEGRDLLGQAATGTGKTTLLAAALGCVPGDERILTVEDTAEAAPEHPHVVALQCRAANA